MTTYSVKYKVKGAKFWKKIKQVKGDILAKDLPDHKIFILESEAQIHIPLTGTLFSYSKERFLTIKQNMEAQAGVDLKVIK